MCEDQKKWSLILWSVLFLFVSNRNKTLQRISDHVSITFQDIQHEFQTDKIKMQQQLDEQISHNNKLATSHEMMNAMLKKEIEQVKCCLQNAWYSIIVHTF